MAIKRRAEVGEQSWNLEGKSYMLIWLPHSRQEGKQSFKGDVLWRMECCSGQVGKPSKCTFGSAKWQSLVPLVSVV